ncbi:restriction endonuclease subunit S [uncultured Helicobacter sp.]|uniref:restriction endonuclease subunit S n=7 Tax=uncultured Helicobacter sp. TaxID=175537 RepID=UPI002637227E|nr:restriction endonuclease subunit S [uncultured Helicobacter sp.]
MKHTLPKEWQRVRLGDIALKIFSGGTPQSTKEEYYQGNIPWLNTGEVKNTRIYQTEKYITELGLQNSSAKWVKIDSVIIALYGATAGKVAINKIPLTTNQACCNIILNSKKAYYEYIYYAISNAYLHLFSLASGTARSNLSVSLIADYKIPLPPLAAQNNIARILSVLDSKIELNNRINKELENLAKLLYTRYFVEFNFPNEQGKPYKSSGGAMVYNETLKREIPKDWEVENIETNSLASIIQAKIDTFTGEKIYLPTSAIQNDVIVDLSNTTTFETRESRANMQPIKDSVWFAKMKDSKKYIYFGDYSNSIYSLILLTGMCGLSCKHNALEYMWNVISSNEFDVMKNAFANGSTQQAINEKTLKLIPLVIPNESVLDDFHAKTYAIYKQKYLNQQESHILSNYRDFLLPLLMNNQVEALG